MEDTEKNILMVLNFAQRLEPDGYSEKKCRVQWDILTHKIQLADIFMSETDLREVATHNSHEYKEISHEEVIGILSFYTPEGWVL